MSQYLEIDLDVEGVLQGDIFEVGENCSDIFKKEEKYAVVITADCDIAQNKMGRFFTLLPIISAQDYLTEYWIKGLFEKELKKIAEEVCLVVNKCGHLKQHGCDPVTAEGMLSWIDEDGLEGVFASLDIEKSKKIDEVVSRYELVSGESNIDGYLSLMKLRNKRERAVKSDITGAIKNSRDEFYFIPDLPKSKVSGHMIKLRDVRSVSKERLYKRAQDLRLSPNDPAKSLLRTGRFSDYLKYSITQQFAMVFSSIGMKDLFEKDADASLDMIASEICNDY